MDKAAAECRPEKAAQLDAEGEQSLGIGFLHLDGKDAHDCSEVEDAEVDDGVAEVEGGEPNGAHQQQHLLEGVVTGLRPPGQRQLVLGGVYLVGVGLSPTLLHLFVQIHDIISRDTHQKAPTR